MEPGAWRKVLPFGDWLYRDAHYLVAEVELDAARARRWVPWPLRLAQPATATVFTAWFPWTGFGSVYREAGLLLHVEPARRRAVHCPWMIVDDDVALVLGRELLGYPKKLGEIDVTVDGDRVEATARRRGHTLVSMRGTLGAVLPDAPPVLGRLHRNLRCELRLAWPRLVSFTPRERAVEVRRAELEVTLGGSERDPLHELGFAGVRAARLHRVDLGAGLGVPHTSGFVSPLSFLRQLRRRIQ